MPICKENNLNSEEIKQLHSIVLDILCEGLDKCRDRIGRSDTMDQDIHEKKESIDKILDR